MVSLWNLPAVHQSQLACPACDWCLPARHVAHALVSDLSENVPTGHSLHELAPAAAPLFVIEPAAHFLQNASVELAE